MFSVVQAVGRYSFELITLNFLGAISLVLISQPNPENTLRMPQTNTVSEKKEQTIIM